MPVVPTLGRLMQDNCQEFKASLYYKARSCLKKKGAGGEEGEREKEEVE